MHVLIDQARQNQKIVEVDFFIGAWHLCFFAYFVDFSSLYSYVAVDDLPFEVGFGIYENRINNHISSRLQRNSEVFVN